MKIPLQAQNRHGHIYTLETKRHQRDKWDAIWCAIYNKLCLVPSMKSQSRKQATVSRTYRNTKLVRASEVSLLERNNSKLYTPTSEYYNPRNRNSIQVVDNPIGGPTRSRKPDAVSGEAYSPRWVRVLSGLGASRRCEFESAIQFGSRVT